MLDGSELCTIEHGLEVAAVLSGPSQGATVLLHDSRQPVVPAAPLSQQDMQEQGVVQQPHDTAEDVLHMEAVASPYAGRTGTSSLQSSDVQTGANEDALDVAAQVAAAGGGDAVADRHLLQGRHQGKAHNLVLQRAAEMSVPKVVSAVVDVDPAEFKRYLLRSFKQ